MIPLLENPRAEHQIRLRQRGSLTVVSCTCLNTWDGTWEMAWKSPWTNPAWRGTRHHGPPIAASTLLSAAEAIGEWRAWHQEQGVEL